MAKSDTRTYSDKRDSILNALARCDTIAIKPQKEIGSQIRAAIKASGKSITDYILDAVRIKMNSQGLALGE